MGILRSLGDQIEMIKVCEFMRIWGLVLLEEMSLESLEPRRDKEQFVSLQYAAETRVSEEVWAPAAGWAGLSHCSSSPVQKMTR